MISPEVREADQRIFWKEVLLPRRIVLQLLAVGLSLVLLSSSNGVSLIFLLFSLSIHFITSNTAAEKKRFLNARFASLWNGCRDRFEDFENGTKKLQKAEIAEFKELPETVRGIAKTLYNSLRRADLLFDEVIESEGKQRFHAGLPHFEATDPQAKELYRIAEKNLGEYRSNYNELMAGIQRTEAQATVFMTTLDTLRVKMLGYRLIGRNPSMNSQEFLFALAEAKIQLTAIDKALDELDLGHYPKTITVESDHPAVAAIVETEDQQRNSL